MRITGQKNPADTLREEIQREKAAALGRAGEMLAQALEKLRGIGEGIDERVRFLEQLTAECGGLPANHPSFRLRQRTIREINGEIDAYNQLREHAQLRYYYFVVTREAMGLLRHDRIREIYVIPDKRGHLG